MGDTTFSPHDDMSRGMFVTVLGRYDQVLTDHFSAVSFDDIGVGDYYTPYVEWACRNEIVEGTGAHQFSPDLPITRQQAVTMLYHYYGGDSGDGSSVLVSDLVLERFADRDEIEGFAFSAVKWAVYNGILQGDGDRLRPGDRISRAEAALLFSTVSGTAFALPERHLFSIDGEQVLNVTLRDSATGSFIQLPGGTNDAAGVLRLLNTYTFKDRVHALPTMDPWQYSVTVRLMDGRESEFVVRDNQYLYCSDSNQYFSLDTAEDYFSHEFEKYLPPQPFQFDPEQIETASLMLDGPTDEFHGFSRDSHEALTDLLGGFTYDEIRIADPPETFPYYLSIFFEPGRLYGIYIDDEYVYAEGMAYKIAEPGYFDGLIALMN